MTHLKLMLLGQFKAFLDGEAISGYKSNKARAMLAYLVTETERPVRRAALAEMIWPDWPEKSAMRNLSFALADLRKNLTDRQAKLPFLLITRDNLQLNPASPIDADLWDFNKLVKTKAVANPDRSTQIEQLVNAANLYSGPFLEGFSLADSAPYEEWLAATRQGLNEKMAQALGTLAEAYLQQADFEHGLLYAQRRVQLEPWLEEGHQQLMRLFALNGQRSLAMAQFETCRKALETEFQVEPGTETVALYEAIRTGKLAKTVSAPEPGLIAVTSEHSGPKHNLPVELSHFIGREEDINQVKQRLAEWRLVTLTGAGGVGKTRLSLAVAEKLLSDYPDGVWLIELAPLSDPSQVTQAIANAIGLREEPDQVILDRLKDFFCKRTSLLVLDNCEHLLDACAGLADILLHNCSQLKILATCREPLGLSGESIFRVPSLSFPEPGQVLRPENSDDYAAVRLFVDRVRQTQASYQVTPENAAALASICQRLDGIPLAIELAAARMHVLTTEELATRLDDVFRLLSAGRRSGVPRHQTLRAMIDWSFNLLNNAERQLLQRLAIFAGDWDLAGAEGVCASDDIPPIEILELLANLVNKSMVAASSTGRGGTRYHMLETIRQYAHEKLVDSGQMAVVQQRSLAYFVEMAETIEPQARGANQKDWRRRLEVDLDNIRKVLNSNVRENPPAGLRLACALWQFWEITGRNLEGSQWLRTYLDQPENAAGTALRGHALWKLTLLNHATPGAGDAAQESLEIFRSLNDLTGQGCAQLCWGGNIIISLEDAKSARQHFNAALMFFEESQDQWWSAVTLYFIAGLAQYEGNETDHFDYLEKALALFRKIGDQNLTANALIDFGQATSFFKGDLLNGHTMLAEAQAIFWQIDFSDASVLHPLSEVLSWQGEFEQVSQVLDKMLEIPRQTGDDIYLHVTNLQIGRHLCLQGRLAAGIALMKQAVNTLKESDTNHYILATQQTFLMELAYAHACLGEIERAEILVAEYGPFFKDVQYQPRLLHLLGFIAFLKGEAEGSASYYRESLRYAVRMKWRLDALLSLEGYAWALTLKPEHVEAVRWLGAAVKFRGQIGAPVFPRDRPFYDQVILTLKERLGEGGYSAAWAEGQAMDFDIACKLI